LLVDDGTKTGVIMRTVGVLGGRRRHERNICPPSTLLVRSLPQMIDQMTPAISISI
jgi:hypothetical protein